MTKGLAAVSEGQNLLIRILNGPDKGAAFRLLSGQVTIGTDSSNDVVIEGDAECAPEHAQILVTSDGLQARVLSHSVTLKIDGQEVQHGRLREGSVLQVGRTKIRIDDPNKLVARKHRSKSSSSRSTGPSPFFLFLVSAVFLVGVFLMLANDSKKILEPEVKTEQGALNTIERNRQIVQNLSEDSRLKGHESPQYKEAQAHFIRGFRDFHKGQFDRALDYFQICLSVFPQHQQCALYYHQAKTRLSELIQYYLNLGYEYQRKNQYSQCKSAFNNVRVMQKDRTSTLFKEADTGYFACEAMERQGRQ
jgi:hypothetical protein